jgi:hypothetical protein
MNTQLEVANGWLSSFGMFSQVWTKAKLAFTPHGSPGWMALFTNTLTLSVPPFASRSLTASTPSILDLENAWFSVTTSA